MDYVVGYGSLLNRYSREHYSGIYCEATAVTVEGWYRSWCASDLDESATYAGAQADANAHLDAVLIPTEINQELQNRERNYQFIELNHKQVFFSSSTQVSIDVNDRLFICASLTPSLASKRLPVPQSYVDTCLLGCFEIGGVQAMTRFVQQTRNWHDFWVNDRPNMTPIYPRFAKPDAVQSELIDQVLSDCGVLHHRSTRS